MAADANLSPADIERLWRASVTALSEAWVSVGGEPWFGPSDLRRLLLTAAREHGRAGGECPYTVEELRRAWEEGRKAVGVRLTGKAHSWTSARVDGQDVLVCARCAIGMPTISVDLMDGPCPGFGARS